MHPTIRILSTFALIIGMPPTGLTADSSTLPVSPRIDNLIAQLGHKQFRVRQAAGTILEERGEEALPLLRKSMEHPDLEIRRRAEVLCEKIERNLLLSPKRVTIRAINAPVDEVLKDITRQTGYSLDFQGTNVPKITLDLVDGTYWEAMQKICSMSGLSYAMDEQQGHIFLYPQERISPYTFIDGPFRFIASSFNYSRRRDLSNIPRNGMIQEMNAANLAFAFTIQAEPKTALLSVGMPVLEKAIDETGASLLPRQADEGDFIVRYFESNQYRRFQHEASVSMYRPNKDALKAKLIQGKVTLTLLSSVRPEVVIDKLAVGMKKPLSAVGASAEVIVEGMTEQNKDYSVMLTINRRGPASEADYNFINTMQQKFELQDAKGRKYACQGLTNIVENDLMHVRGTLLFVPNNAEVGKPVKLILNQWLTMAHEVNFQFKDLPLP